ncbi:Excisionase [Parendozoicomonas haliclonae]|uniref:Excisionase n=1 Tax=Parendozoicomonas haliclonae TaxID=1960125 RepID=A0A1X7AES3_9GAMM|nr:hypothetical protein EHSB41UT_00314 [Parendozoicomonas haliclonae]
MSQPVVVQVVPQGWMKAELYFACTKETTHTLRAKRRRNLIREGYHVKQAADGAVWVHYERMQDWVEQSIYVPPEKE